MFLVISYSQYILSTAAVLSRVMGKYGLSRGALDAKQTVLLFTVLKNSLQHERSVIVQQWFSPSSQ